MTDIYKRLAKHLDNLPASFPPTDSGVEIRILKNLFTPEEAEKLPVPVNMLEEYMEMTRERGLV